MTRDDALDMQAQLFPKQETLLEICQNLRMACNGSADPWHERVVRSVREMLQARIDTWDHKRMLLFDAAVYFLVQATLKETEAP